MAVKAKGTNPNYHVQLSDGEQVIGIVLTNPAGQQDERVLRRHPSSSTQNPYVTETQSSWDGGFGHRDFEDDRTGYWLSKGMDLTKSGRLAIGPRVRYAKGVRTADELDTGTNIGWYTLLGVGLYRAQKFTASANYTTAYVKFPAKKVGKPAPLSVRLRQDDAGNPGTVIDFTTYTSSTGKRDEHTVKVTLAGALTSGTAYWVEWFGSARDSNDNHWLIKAGKDESNGKLSANGSSWGDASAGYLFRLCNADVTGLAHFFEYKGQLYAGMEYDNHTTCKLLMNGWRGAADSNVANKNRLFDSTQTGWTAAKLAGCVARMVAGPASAEVDDWRHVDGGDSGYATCEQTWEIEHTTQDDYVILGSDEWSEIPRAAAGSGFPTRITDIAVANGMAFICQGNRGQMVIHREYNDNGTWTADNSTNCWRTTGGVRAQFARVLNDPISGPVLWMGYNPGLAGRYRPQVFKAVPTDWEDGTLNRLVIEDCEDAWTMGSARVISTYKAPPIATQQLRVEIGVITAINATPTAGGSGYTALDVLTITQANSSSTATLRVDTVDGSGAVTALTLLTGGYDYSTGSGKPTTGGTGTGCTIEITTIASFTTGILAYENLPATLDVRNYNRLVIKYYLHNSATGIVTLDAGDISVILSKQSNAAHATVTATLGTITPGKWFTTTLAIDPESVDGADVITSIGLQLNTTKSKTFSLVLNGEIYVRNDYPVIEVGEDGDNITGLESYGDPETVWVLTETGIGEIVNNVYLPVPLRELKTTRHPNNGRAHIVNDTYLYMSWRGRLQRFFRQNLENLGPNYPQEWATADGMIVDIAGYADRLFVAVDGGPSKPSQILVLKDNAFHELYTSLDGERIRSLYIQAIPGKSDRLWFSVGAEIAWMPITLDPTNIDTDGDYEFRHEGYLESPFIHTSRNDLDKLFRSLVVFGEDLASTQRLEVEYLLDDETAFLHMGPVTEGPFKEVTLGQGSPPANIHGNRLRYKIRLRTNDSGGTPILRQVTARTYTAPELKYTWTMIAKLGELSVDLQGDEGKVLGTFKRTKGALALLDRWSRNLTPLTVTTNISGLDGQTVLLAPLPAQLLLLLPDESLEEQVVQLSLGQV